LSTQTRTCANLDRFGLAGEFNLGFVLDDANSASRSVRRFCTSTVIDLFGLHAAAFPVAAGASVFATARPSNALPSLRCPCRPRHVHAHGAPECAGEFELRLVLDDGELDLSVSPRLGLDRDRLVDPYATLPSRSASVPAFDAGRSFEPISKTIAMAGMATPRRIVIINPFHQSGGRSRVPSGTD
jgi:hypothetical protein